MALDSLTRSLRVKKGHDDDEYILRDAHSDTQRHAKMFYSQRNMYLTGFTLFLALYVIHG